jgi:hypothetical protein
MSRPTTWAILIDGYGVFSFIGTAEEAEEMRCHKANWEQGIGKKRRATPAEIAAAEYSACWNHPGFNNKYRYACDCDACAKERS